MLSNTASRLSAFKYPCLALLFIFLYLNSFSQYNDPPGYKTVIAGKQYKRTSFHNWLWGADYRKDWATPVLVPVVNLDTIDGGLIPYEKGGGRQTKNLHLRNKDGREYVLRSIDKSFGKALPDIARGTFIEDIADDQVAISEPYSSLTIPMMAEAAGIYHTNPMIIYVPSQKALGEFDKDYGNDLYMLEQRPDENWDNAPNFGFSKNIVGTDKMLEKLLKDHDNTTDQQMYVRSRLFDMFIGDWGRHEDQWRWASFKNGDKTLYRPIPRDRDQAYSKVDGILTHVATSAVADYIDGFRDKIKYVIQYNYTARNLDRRLMNAVPRDQWASIASELKIALSDQVIETAVHKLPPEVAKNSAAEIISHLKNRRNLLSEWAASYYRALAENVNIVGSEKNEYFTINKISEEETQVQVYAVDNSGVADKTPYYSRTFSSKETDEIRIYGISGNDQFKIEGKPNRVKVRIIGGPMKDIYINSGNENHILVYDNPGNDFTRLKNARKMLSADSSINQYEYAEFKNDVHDLGFSPSYNEDDHIHVAMKYVYEKQQWRKKPFGYHHELALRYSISEAAPSIGYDAVYNKMLGNWDILFGANYDWIRWNNFYGIGNETKNLTTDPNYNRARSRQLDAWFGVNRDIKYHKITAGIFYQTVRIVNDKERFLSKQMPSFQEYDTKQFGGAQVGYKYENIDNTVLPTKGVRFNIDARYTQNLKNSDSSVANFSSAIHIYLPIAKWLVFKNKTGGATLTGKPEFYQLSKLGGGKSLRGFRRYRFYGESSFYNQAELQIVPNIKTYLFNGRAGFVGFYDIGRVWQPGENSSTWHYGYGGGIVISPFNKVALMVLHGWSKDEQAFSIRFNAGF